MRASAGILFFIWGCEGGKTVTEPVMTELTGLDTPTSVAVATAVGTGTVQVPVRLLNDYGASVAGEAATVSVDGPTAALAQSVIHFDASGYALAEVSADIAEVFTLTVESTTDDVGGASGTSYATGGTIADVQMDRGAPLPSDLRDADFIGRGTGGTALAEGTEVWFVPDDPGVPAHAVATLPFAIAGMWSAHVDTDGVLDLVLWGEDQAIFLRGRAGGGYSWGGGWMADAGSVVGVSVNDLDGDRLPDVAIGMSGDATSTVQILSGDGAWGFSHADSLELNYTIMGLAAADEEGDGTAEVSVLVESSGLLRRYTQAEEGWVGATGPELGEDYLDGFAGATGTTLLPPADLDDDGDPDYVLVGPSGSSQDVIFITIDDEVTFYTLSYSQAHAIADNVNGASPDDLLVLDNDGLAVITYQGEGSDPLYRSRKVTLEGDTGPLAISDTNGDDVMDVSVAGDALKNYRGSLDADQVWDKTDWDWKTYSASLSGQHIYGDFDEDGALDFISLSDDSGQTELKVWTLTDVDGTTKLLAGDDLTLDGIDAESLAVCEESSWHVIYAIVATGSTHTLVKVALDNGGNLTEEASQTVSGNLVACGDFASGEVAVSNNSGTWGTYTDDGAGGFTATGSTGSLGTSYALGAADTDGDGEDELVSCELDGCSLGIGDTDGDGLDEIVRGGSTLSWENDGELSVIDGAGTVTLVDVDGDGMLDIVASDADNAQIYVDRGLSGGVAPAVLYHTAHTLEGPATFGDVTGDGLPEIVVGGGDGAIAHTGASL